MEKKDENKVFCPNYGFVDKTSNFLVLGKSALFEQILFSFSKDEKVLLGTVKVSEKNKQKKLNHLLLKSTLLIQKYPEQIVPNPQNGWKNKQHFEFDTIFFIWVEYVQKFLGKEKKYKKTQFILLMKCFGFYFSIQ